MAASHALSAGSLEVTVAFNFISGDYDNDDRYNNNIYMCKGEDTESPMNTKILVLHQKEKNKLIFNFHILLMS